MLSAMGGTPPYFWALNSGALPPGLSLSASGGAISGTPSQAGTFSFTIQVSDSAGQSATAKLSIQIAVAPVPLLVMTTSLPNGTASQAYNATLTASGGTPPYNWTLISGALPAGLNLGISSGAVSGTPAQSGAFNFTIQVSDPSGQSASANLSIQIAATFAPLQITTGSLPNGTVSASYSAGLSATGGAPPYNWAVSSSVLPSGLALNTGSGAISGTPTQSGTFPFTIQVKDAGGHSAVSSLSIQIASTSLSLQITTTSLPAGTVSQTYSAALAAAGGTSPYTWSLSGGSLPGGLTLSSSGVISGIPTGTGSFSFTVTVTDATQQTASQNLSISVASATSTTCGATGAGVCYYVSPAGSDSNPGTNAAPFLTIQHAAGLVNPGDMVIVEDGTYSDASVSGVGSKLIVMSRGGTASNHVVFVSEHKWGAKIDGLNNTSDTGWEFAANYIDVKDFECEGFANSCFENYNGGQYIDIAGNNIHDVGRYCTTTTNGRVGIFVSNPNVIIEGNQIHDIGRYAPGENGCTNSLFYQNNDHGIYVDGAFAGVNNLTVKNNIFYRNERGWSIQVYPAAVDNLQILNNTFMCPNPYRSGHITLSAALTNSAIENNISWQPTISFLLYTTTSGYSNVSVANNLTYQGTVGNASAPSGVSSINNLDNTDPLLVSAPSCTMDAPSFPNVNLQPGSPALDVGLTLLNVPIDYNATVRPLGGYDIGAIQMLP